MLTVAHLTSTSSFGGPERQMLGLAAAGRSHFATLFLPFHESGRAKPFVDEITAAGFESMEIGTAARGAASHIRAIADVLRERGIDVLCAHGYKANLLGLAAARSARRPIVAVSRGWTAATRRVRVYERLDRLALRRMDRVVCVSEAQANRVRVTGVPDRRIVVIRNAIRPERFARPSASDRDALDAMFRVPPRFLVGAAGRLSPEKGFELLADAAALVLREVADAGFVLVGDGPLRERLRDRIERLRIQDHFVLAGHRRDLDRLMPNFDVVVLPSYTEGLPNVALEAHAARVPVVATAVGGTPEVVRDGTSGLLVPAGRVDELADAICTLLRSDERRRAMGGHGYERVCEAFTFTAQARQYAELFHALAGNRRHEQRGSRATATD